MEIVKYKDYRKYIIDKIKSYPQNGYGVQSRLCEAAGVFTSYMAGVLKGEKQLTPEQALAVADFFQLNPNETDFFVELVHIDRAGTGRLKKYHQEKLYLIKEKLTALTDRSKPEKELSISARAIFYSDWRYSAIRNACAFAKMTPQKIAVSLKIKIEVVHRILDFLTQHELVIIEKEYLKIGPTFTRIRSTDPLVYRHHANWRQRAVESFAAEKTEDLHITAPVTLSSADALVVRDLLHKNMNKVLSVVEPSESEELWCVNIDWFKIS